MKIELTESQKELLQKWANANATCSCGGHYKGEQNELLRLQYAMELREMGIMVYASLTEYFYWKEGKFEVNVDLPQGIFNGVGSY